MNETRNERSICAIDVPVDLSHENDRRTLHRARNRVTADSPDGHTYSNILELRKNWESSRPGDFAQQHLPSLMDYQAKRLSN